MGQTSGTHGDDMPDNEAKVHVGGEVTPQARRDDLDGVRDGADDECPPRQGRAHVAGKELREVLGEEDEPRKAERPDEAADHDLAVSEAIDERGGDEDADDGRCDGAAAEGALQVTGSASHTRLGFRKGPHLPF